LSYSLEHLVLHSFPTRRSSDLSLTVALRFGDQESPLQYQIASTKVDMADLTDAFLLRQIRISRAHCATSKRKVISWILFRRHWEDRKSTRLNSSHVSISYAVFC